MFCAAVNAPPLLIFGALSCESSKHRLMPRCFSLGTIPGLQLYAIWQKRLLLWLLSIVRFLSMLALIFGAGKDAFTVAVRVAFLDILMSNPASTCSQISMTLAGMIIEIAWRNKRGIRGNAKAADGDSGARGTGGSGSAGSSSEPSSPAGSSMLPPAPADTTSIAIG